MLKTDRNLDDVLFILNNIKDEDELELQALWGKNWKQLAFENIKNTNYMVLVGSDGKGNFVPIAIGGFEQIHNDNKQIACAWLLSSKFIKYNKSLFFKTIAVQLYFASQKYKILYNYIYMANFKSKRWLKRFGFCFNNPRPENLNVPDRFEFFYKLSN